MTFIDYAKVRQLISLEAVLAALEYVPAYNRGNRRYGRCPLGCSDYIRACSFDMERKLFFCHKCNTGGNHLDLYRRRFGCGIGVAALLLCQFCGIDLPTFEVKGK